MDSLLHCLVSIVPYTIKVMLVSSSILGYVGAHVMMSSQIYSLYLQVARTWYRLLISLSYNFYIKLPIFLKNTFYILHPRSEILAH